MSETVRYNIVLNDEVSAKLAAIESKFESLESSIKDSNSSLSKMGKTMNASMFLNAANMAFQAGQAIWGMAEAHVKAAGAIQANMNALRVASGSTEEYNRNTAFLNSITEKLPISIESATEGLKMWTAATMNSSLRGDTARQVFEDVSTATASMGIDAETTKGIFLAMSQMMSKGTVQAEELRGQLGERLPGAFTLMAKSMGVTEQRLGKMMENGEVVASEVLPKFASVLKNEFGGGVKEASNSINAIMTRLDNLRVKGIMAMTPRITEMLLAFERFAIFVQGLDFEPLVDVFDSWARTFDPIIDSLNRLFGGVSGGTVAFQLLATAIQTFLVPMKLAVTAFNTLLIAIETAINLSTALANGEFSKMPDILADQATKLKDNYLNAFSDIKDGYAEIWDQTAVEKGKAMEAATAGIDFGFMDKKGISAPLSSMSTSVAKTGKTKALKEANANIQGSAPRQVSINIQNLIGQNTNNIQRDGEKESLDAFTKRLLQALQQELVNVNLQGL